MPKQKNKEVKKDQKLERAFKCKAKFLEVKEEGEEKALSRRMSAYSAMLIVMET